MAYPVATPFRPLPPFPLIAVSGNRPSDPGGLRLRACLCPGPPARPARPPRPVVVCECNGEYRTPRTPGSRRPTRPAWRSHTFFILPGEFNLAGQGLSRRPEEETMGAVPGVVGDGAGDGEHSERGRCGNGRHGVSAAGVAGISDSRSGGSSPSAEIVSKAASTTRAAWIATRTRPPERDREGPPKVVRTGDQRPSTASRATIARSVAPAR